MDFRQIFSMNLCSIHILAYKLVMKYRNKKPFTQDWSNRSVLSILMFSTFT